MQGQAICKDCGNGTLNNELNPQFEYNGSYVYCLNCGSSHVDGELYEANDEPTGNGFGDGYTDIFGVSEADNE